MKAGVFENRVIDFEKEALFLGTGRNVARLDLNIEQWVQNTTDQALGNTWFKFDFSYTQDGKDFLKLDELQQLLFLANLKFQTVLDSVATRTVMEVFKPITTNPQLESWWVVHGFQEDVHSQSYAELIKALPIDAKKIFDEIMVTPEIIQRAELIVDTFNDTVMWNARMTIGTEDYDVEQHKVSIVKSLFALNILEAGLFQTSFITTFAFGERGIMESSAKAMGRIKKDENLHMAMTQYLINKHKKDIDWGYIFEEYNDDIISMYQSSYDADLAWIDYLFKDGVTLLGINATILKEYAQYNMWRAMNAIGLSPVVDRIRTNPCLWSEKYTKTANLQVALNEADGTNYLLGRLNKSMIEEDWGKMSLQS